VAHEKVRLYIKFGRMLATFQLKVFGLLVCYLNHKQQDAQILQLYIFFCVGTKFGLIPNEKNTVSGTW
jgi:hypothetical protein